MGVGGGGCTVGQITSRTKSGRDHGTDADSRVTIHLHLASTGHRALKRKDSVPSPWTGAGCSGFNGPVETFSSPSQTGVRLASP